MSGSTLAAAILIGVLLPASFARPRFLVAAPIAEHHRRRRNFLYSCGAFAAMSYVYVSAAYVLRPVHDVSVSERRVIGGGGLILLAIACSHHLPPLIIRSRSRAANAATLVATVALGGVIGGFLAIDEVFAQTHAPILAATSWIVLALITVTVTACYSGLSPEMRLALYARRRRRRLARRNASSGARERDQRLGGMQGHALTVRSGGEVTGPASARNVSPNIRQVVDQRNVQVEPTEQP